jgi:hypothetical protein
MPLPRVRLCVSCLSHRRKVVALAVIGSWFAGLGCSATRTMGAPNSRRTLEQVALATVDRPVTVELRGESAEVAQREGTIESLRGGTLVLLNGRELHRIPMQDVRRIEVTNRQLGMRDGFLWGLLAEVLACGAFVSAYGSHVGSTGKAVAGCGLFGLVFVVGPGVAIGRAVGHRTILDFEGP